MRQHRDEVWARLSVDALVPQIHEIAEALAKDPFALLFAFDHPALIRNGGRDVRPVAELPPVLEREVEQRRQHLAGELDRHLVHPVEGFAARQAVEQVANARADQAFEIGEILRRDDRLHHLALHVMLGRVHGDEHRQFDVERAVAQGYAAERRTGREPPMVYFERNDVLVLGDRPIRPERACRAIVDRRLAPQPAEIGLPHVVLIEFGVADVELVERHGLGEGRVIDGFGCIQDRCEGHLPISPSLRPHAAGRRAVRAALARRIGHEANGLHGRERTVQQNAGRMRAGPERPQRL